MHRLLENVLIYVSVPEPLRIAELNRFSLINQLLSWEETEFKALFVALQRHYR